MSSVASASVAEAVMPTAVLSAAFSTTVLSVASVSLVAPMSTSSTSVRVSVKVASAWELSADVARTVTVQDSSVSRSKCVRVCDGDYASRAVADLQCTSAGLGGDGVGHGVGGRVGVACRGGDPDGLAVGDVLGHGVGCAIRICRGGDVGLIDICQGECKQLVCNRVVGGCRSDCDCAGLAGLAVEGRCVGDGDDAGRGVYGERACAPSLDAVGHRVGGRVGVAGRGGDPDGLAVGDVLGHGVGRGVGVGRRGDVGLVDVGQGEREGLVGRGAVGAGRAYGHGAAVSPASRSRAVVSATVTTPEVSSLIWSAPAHDWECTV